MLFRPRSLPRERADRIGTALHLLGLAFGGVAVLACLAMVEADPVRLVAGCVLGWSLLALAWIDARQMRLPDGLTLPLLIAGLIEAALLDPNDLLDRTIGAIIGYCAFRLLAAGYERLRGRAGLGEGDAKLLAAAGAWVGWRALPDLVLIAAVSGLAAMLVHASRGRGLDPERRLPFGPFLAFATWLVWLLGAWFRYS